MGMAGAVYVSVTEREIIKKLKLEKDQQKLKPKVKSKTQKFIIKI